MTTRSDPGPFSAGHLPCRALGRPENRTRRLEPFDASDNTARCADGRQVKRSLRGDGGGVTGRYLCATQVSATTAPFRAVTFVGTDGAASNAPRWSFASKRNHNVPHEHPRFACTGKTPQHNSEKRFQQSLERRPAQGIPEERLIRLGISLSGADIHDLKSAS
jgi:hypothetical protein